MKHFPTLCFLIQMQSIPFAEKLKPLAETLLRMP